MVWRGHLFTLLKRQVKAGILIYALLMAAIFALLLQFYLGRVVAMERQHQAQLSASRAYLMAELTKDLAKEDTGHLTFDQGVADYNFQDNQLQVVVKLPNQQEFDYVFQSVQKEKAN
ncbi:Uncharacterized protein BN963_SGAL_02301 [Streptococcus gallolyticus]|uniref:Competence protein ComGG n=1 Tax=Streptococcus gallolyticus TaxID=315405 RepID=A0A060RJD6_9STRE|nr:Uncharacterized protein BN963_SGAL_02301 [Streptococcus gallolyticus]